MSNIDEAVAAIYDVQRSVERDLGAIRSLLEQILDALRPHENVLPSTFTFEPEIVAPLRKAEKTLQKMGIAA